MPDQDEFDPIGRDWRRAYDQCMEGDMDFDKVGESLLRALTRMLQQSGGCAVFDDLAVALERLTDTMLIVTDERARRPEYAQFSAQLDNLARKPGVIDRRLDVLAIRTARVLAVQLVNGSYKPGSHTELRLHLGVDVAQNLLCHRALDAARAHAVGFAFASQASAHEYHDRLIESLADHIARVGRQLSVDPTGRRVRHVRLVPAQTTAAILWDEAWRVDEPEDDPYAGIAIPEINDDDQTDRHELNEDEYGEDTDLFDGLGLDDENDDGADEERNATH